MTEGRASLSGLGVNKSGNWVAESGSGAMAVALGSVAQAWSVTRLQSSIDGTAETRVPPPAVAGVTVSAGRRSVDARATAGAVRAALGGSRGGAGVLERPKLDQSGSDTTPQTEEGMDNVNQLKRISGFIYVNRFLCSRLCSYFQFLCTAW